MPKAQFFEGSYPKGNNSEKTFVDEYIRDKNFQENIEFKTREAAIKIKKPDWISK